MSVDTERKIFQIVIVFFILCVLAQIVLLGLAAYVQVALVILEVTK